METINTNKQELLIEQSKYHILVEEELRSLKFNTSIHTKFAGLLFFNIILASFFCWASSGSESNIYKYPHSNILIYSAINLIFIIWPITVLISACNRKKFIDKEMLTCQTKIINTFVSFINKKIQNECNVDFTDFNAKKKYFKTHTCTVEFTQSEFETYIENILSTYSKHISFAFCSNYSYFSLLSLCLIEILERTSCGIEPKYYIDLKKSQLILAKILSE